MTDVHVVLSGAGARFPVFVGALKAMEDAGLRVRQLIGTSGGALVGGFYKRGVPLPEMERLALDIDYSQYASLSLARFAAFPLRGYLSPSGPVRELLQQSLGGGTFAEVPDFAAVVTDLTHEATIICHAETMPDLALVDGVYASGAIPLVLEPFESARGVWVDGSLRYDFALDWPHLRDGLPIIGVKVRSPYTAPHSSAPFEIVRAVVANVIDANDRRHMDEATYSRYVDVVTPVGALQFNLSRADKIGLIQHGYDATRSALPQVLAASRNQAR